ncbi:type II secretion system protein [Paraherbaspirillum soli]|uniref:Type II secretion system protein n=1 Tax=Paraherbaspirillum soli TaxID=631222 RepID=A0ABW0MFF1_9BURK
MRMQRGFSLIELLAALTLLALLMTVAAPVSDLIKQRRQEAEMRQTLATVRTAIDAYKRATADGSIEKSIEQSGYPPDLNVLVEGVANKKDPSGAKLYFLRRLPPDPMCDSCDGKSPADSWETRSYDSSPESFSSGSDVFDIRSSSKKPGLNGVPYNEW